MWKALLYIDKRTNIQFLFSYQNYLSAYQLMVCLDASTLDLSKKLRKVP